MTCYSSKSPPQLLSKLQFRPFMKLAHCLHAHIVASVKQHTQLQYMWICASLFISVLPFHRLLGCACCSAQSGVSLRIHRYACMRAAYQVFNRALGFACNWLPESMYFFMRAEKLIALFLLDCSNASLCGHVWMCCRLCRHQFL